VEPSVFTGTSELTHITRDVSHKPPSLAATSTEVRATVCTSSAGEHHVKREPYCRAGCSQRSSAELATPAPRTAGAAVPESDPACPHGTLLCGVFSARQTHNHTTFSYDTATQRNHQASLIHSNDTNAVSSYPTDSRVRQQARQRSQRSRPRKRCHQKNEN
jgi:hypothetical protein